jgi:hypothetical protein
MQVNTRLTILAMPILWLFVIIGGAFYLCLDGELSLASGLFGVNMCSMNFGGLGALMFNVYRY